MRKTVKYYKNVFLVLKKSRKTTYIILVKVIYFWYVWESIQNEQIVRVRSFKK